jgi:hypothetical protein
MVISFEIIKHDTPEDIINLYGQLHRIPLLVTRAQYIEGEKNILEYLEDLRKFKAEWDKFQSDSCYCDEDGNIE